jgi:hypothetical protein
MQSGASGLQCACTVVVGGLQGERSVGSVGLQCLCTVGAGG